MTELDKEEDVHLFLFLSFQLSVGFCHSFSSSFIDCTPKQKACWRAVKKGTESAPPLLDQRMDVDGIKVEKALPALTPVCHLSVI